MMDMRQFEENLLRFYLGKYENRFKPVSSISISGIILCTDPHPILAIHLHKREVGPWIILYEYIEIEPCDPYYGAFDFYCNEIIQVPAGDPNGAEKIEIAVAKSFLAGTTL